MAVATPTAESRCTCGKARLQFLRPVPVLHVHCCCISCRQGRDWVASQGGPPVKQGATLVYYFENDLAPLEPNVLSLLHAAKLRESGRTTRLITKCCHSVLALDHPYYEENVVCVHADVCDLVAPRIEPLCRIYSTDWDGARDGDMPSATAALEDSEGMRRLFAGCIKRPVTRREGIKLQEILAQLPPPTSLGLAEDVRLLPPGVRLPHA
jgi:hypothetical protein